MIMQDLQPWQFSHKVYTSILSTQCASINTLDDAELEGNHDFTATISGITTNLAGVVSIMAPLSSI